MKTSLTFIAYLTISIVTMAFSGMISSKTIYDTYYARQAGAIVSVSDLTQAKNFYGSTLNFASLDKPSSLVINADVPTDSQPTYSLRYYTLPSYTLPGGSVIILSPNTSSDSANRSNILVKVRNGFHDLHKTIVERHGNEAVEITWDEYDPTILREYQKDLRRNLSQGKLPAEGDQSDNGLISRIIKRTWGEEFIALDPDGNAITYYYESTYSNISHQLRLEAAKVTRQSSPSS